VRVVNPAAHAAAQQKDLQLQQLLADGGQLPPLFCVPILVKVRVSIHEYVVVLKQLSIHSTVKLIK
jgi:hypothetical protein